MNKKSFVLSVIIPVYNEVRTIEQVIDEVKSSGIKKIELIVVDDKSSDGTQKILQKNKKIDKLILRKENGGKGAAVRDGISKATGDIVIIQDADLEYRPKDFQRLVEPILEGHADVVYGSRFVGNQPHRAVYFWHKLGNSFLTFLSNIFTNLNLTDMETGYKAFKKEVIKSLDIVESDFGMEPEITAKVARKYKVYEVGISYYGRTYEEGKKIQATDFLRAVWVIIKWGVISKLVD